MPKQEKDKKAKSEKIKTSKSVGGKGEKAQKKKRNIRFLDPTWEDYCADHGTPRSFPALVWNYIKGMAGAFIHHLPQVLIPMVIVYVVMFLFNVYFWSILNDTMWIGRGTVGASDLAPYLVGGGVYEGTPFKGVSPFDKAGDFMTGTLVAPLTFALGLLIPRLIYRILQRGPFAPVKDFFSVLPLRKHYMKEREAQDTAKKNTLFLRTGILCASVAGFLIRNPFAVFVFMLLFFFSFGQGAESQIGQGIFFIKASNKKLHDGRRKDHPFYSDGMLWLYYLAVGFAIYTAVNVVLWVLFDYNFYARLAVTVVLAVVSLAFAGTGKKQIAATAAGFLALFGFFLWLDRLTALADDDGWSESGRSAKGLMQNGGWPKGSKSSGRPAVSGDTGTLLSQLQGYQKVLENKAANGEASKADEFALNKLKQMQQDLKDGKTVSANEVASVKKLMQDSNSGQLGGDPNAQVKPPGFFETLGEASAQTLEDLARADNAGTKIARMSLAGLTGGSSEVVLIPAQAGYNMADEYANNPNLDPNNWGTRFSQFAREGGSAYVNMVVSDKISGAITGKLGIQDINISTAINETIHGESGALVHFGMSQTVGNTVGEVTSMVYDAGAKSPLAQKAGQGLANYANDVNNIMNHSSTTGTVMNAENSLGNVRRQMRLNGEF